MTTEVNTREKLSGWLVNYCRARDAETQAKNEKEAIGSAFKEWLDENPGDVLVDGEHGLQALLKTRTGTESYDVYNMPAELVLRLYQARALQVDVKVIRALAGKDILPEDVKPFRVPGNETKALHVEDIK